MQETVTVRGWHGGAPGLRAGELLLPPSATGLTYTRLHMSLEEGLSEVGQRPDRVYVTTDKELAWAYASSWTRTGLAKGGGWLYRVEIDNPEPDADLLSLEGISFQAASARVLGANEIDIPLDAPRCANTFHRVLMQHAAAKEAESPN